jgi:hypothetical protein
MNAAVSVAALGEGERLSPELLPSHHRKVFAQDLSADRNRAVGRCSRQSDARPVKQRRPVGRRKNQHFGVDKGHQPSSS